MRPTLITLTLLTAAAAAIGQKMQSPVQAGTMTFSGCPVGIAAQRQGLPAAIWTTSLEDAQKSGADLKAMRSGVHVDLNAARKQIKQAELAVFYFPPGTRALLVTGSQFAPSSARTSETSKNFSLVSGKDASSQLDGDLLLGPVASVTHVSLMHVTYADGTEWTADSSATCSIKPSFFLLVEKK